MIFKNPGIYYNLDQEFSKKVLLNNIKCITMSGSGNTFNIISGDIIKKDKLNCTLKDYLKLNDVDGVIVFYIEDILIGGGIIEIL